MDSSMDAGQRISSDIIRHTSNRGMETGVQRFPLENLAAGARVLPRLELVKEPARTGHRL